MYLFVPHSSICKFFGPWWWFSAESAKIAGRLWQVLYFLCKENLSLFIYTRKGCDLINCQFRSFSTDWPLMFCPKDDYDTSCQSTLWISRQTNRNSMMVRSASFDVFGTKTIRCFIEVVTIFIMIFKYIGKKCNGFLSISVYGIASSQVKGFWSAPLYISLM